MSNTIYMNYDEAKKYPKAFKLQDEIIAVNPEQKWKQIIWEREDGYGQIECWTAINVKTNRKIKYYWYRWSTKNNRESNQIGPRSNGVQRAKQLRGEK